MTQRVLIIEDDDVVRGLMAAQLTEAGFAVSAVGSGEAAKASLSAEPGAFAAIVCDVALPGMSGPEALADAGAVALGGAGVLFLSGLAHAPDIHLEAGRRTARLAKPFQPAELLAAVRALAG